MKAVLDGHEAKEKTSLAEAVNSLLKKNRLPLLILSGLLLLVLVVIGVGSVIDRSLTQKSTLALEKLEDAYQELGAAPEAEKSEKSKLVKELADLVIADYSKAYAGLRARFIVASILADQKDYQSAEQSFLTIAELNNRSHLTATALVNAATMAEERGDLSVALQHIERALGLESDFAGFNHAVFNKGRILEGLKQYEEARATYQGLIDRGAVDDWTNLARSRLIQINALTKNG